MNTHTVENRSEPRIAASSELERLIAEVAKWGMEAGFLGFEDDHLEARLAALVRDSSEKLFGNCEADRDRLESELDSREIEFNAASRAVAAYLSASRAVVPGGLIRRFFSWLRAYRDYCSARSVCHRLEPALQELKKNLIVTECACGASADWRKQASAALPANYQFHKTRAAHARPAEEKNDVNREAASFVVRRAS